MLPPKTRCDQSKTDLLWSYSEATWPSPYFLWIFLCSDLRPNCCGRRRSTQPAAAKLRSTGWDIGLCLKEPKKWFGKQNPPKHTKTLWLLSSKLRKQAISTVSWCLGRRQMDVCFAFQLQKINSTVNKHAGSKRSTFDTSTLVLFLQVQLLAAQVSII